MQKLTNLLVENPQTSGIVIAVAIVVLGLFVYGFGDLMKFTFKRVWAISGVVFRESIRRKILWLTPLLMLAIVALTTIQRPEDELDAIRQTLQFSLFASGLLVVISGVMLACTNLPRDIESKVIFTIVTKPTTRLEIVLGKIIGFARVTGAILLLMGTFTWAYSHYRAMRLQGQIAQTLSQRSESEFVVDRLTHLQREGLLDTRRLALTNRTDTIAVRNPTMPTTAPAAPENVRWVSSQQSVFVPFRTVPNDLVPQGFHDPSKGETAPNPGELGIVIRAPVWLDRVGSVEVPQAVVQAPMLPDLEAQANPYGSPDVLISLVDPQTDYDIVASSQINGGRPVSIKTDASGNHYLEVLIDKTVAPALANVRVWAVSITPANANYLMGFAPGTLTVTVPGNGPAHTRTLDPLKDQLDESPVLITRGGAGRSGRLLEGPEENYHAVSVSHFHGVNAKAGSAGTVALELTMDIERLDDDAGEENTQVEVRIADPATGDKSPPVYVTPEKNKTVYADLPADLFKSDTFNVELRTLTRGHAVALQPSSIAIVESRHSFGLNLFKAMFTQWMLSVLVVTIGTACSTFLSWPIAIVLSITLLMGRWAVNQVSDSLQVGIGSTIATDSGITDPTQARVISTTFDGLARILNFVSQFLPDIDSFSTLELVQRGLLVPMSAIGSAALVLALFGLPLLSLSYIILRNKEVAP
jgi:hypothetical protein